MTTTQSTQLTSETLMGIARGAIDWRVLERFGVEADLDRLPATLHEPAGLPVVQVTAGDLGTGFTALPGDRTALRQWAQIMTMCLCFDFESLEDDPVGDALLNALWDLAYGGSLDAKRVAVFLPTAVVDGSGMQTG